MSKGGGTTSTIDPRLFSLLDTNYKNAQGIAAMPYQAYTGQITPIYGFNPGGSTGGTSGSGGTTGTPTASPPVGGGFLSQIFQHLAGTGGTSGSGTSGGTSGGAAGGWQPLPDTPTGTYLDYARNLVASPSGTTQQAWNTILGGAMDTGRGALDRAVGGATDLLSYTAPDAYPPQLPTGHGYTAAAINRGDIANISPQTSLGSLKAYMNPYATDVIDASLRDLNRSRQLGINQNASSATLSNAFGGDRQGVENAETNRAFADAASRMIAGLRNQGFDTAAGLLQNDQAKNMQAQLANQGADLSVAGQNTGYGQQAAMYNAGAANQAEQFGADLLARLGLADQQANLASAGVRSGASGLLGNLGGAQQNQFTTGANSLLGIGRQQDAYQQALLDAAYQQFLRQQGYPVDMQQVLNSALGMFGSANGSAQYREPQSLLGNVLGGVGTLFGAL